MKKFLLSILTILTLIVMVPNVSAANKAKVYMFTKDGCSACASATEYFSNLATNEKYKDLFELIDLEIFDGNWQAVSDDAYNLMINTLDHFGESTKPEDIATPLIVIGDYHTVGLSQDTSAVENAIETASKSEEEVDVVKDIANENEIDLNSIIKKAEPAEETGKYDALIIIGIFIVLIGGFAGLVILGRKK